MPNFGKAILVLAIALLVPTGLVLASQDAIPGDPTYPIKRTLENGITAIASIHPLSRAYFKTDLSQRRFRESLALMDKGISATSSLTELVDQTQAAASEIIALTDKNYKKQLASSLSTKIDEYNKALAKVEISKKIPAKTVKPTPTVGQPNSQPTIVVITQTIREDSDNQRLAEELKRIQEELKKLQEQLKSQSDTPPNPQRTEGLTSTPTTRPTATPVVPTPTSTPTPTPKNHRDSAMERLFQIVGQPTATPSSEEQVATSSGTALGISTKFSDLKESIIKFLINLFH